MLLSIAIAASLSAVQADAPAAVAAAPEAAAPAKSLYDAMVSEAGAAAARHLPVDDSNDQIRRMQSTDRDEARYFSRPDATRIAYDREWTQCRQIARRLASSRSDGALMSAAFTHGGIAGGLIVGGLDAGFSMRRARRDIRRQCLIARGWRMVEPDEAGKQRIALLSRDERNAYFDRMLGAHQVEAGATVTDQQTLEAAAPGSNRLGSAGDDD
jgi:hypothetical protein